MPNTEPTDVSFDINALVETIKRSEKFRRPQTYSKNSISPYYKEPYGLQLKAVFDQMIEDRTPKIWRYDDPRWCGSSHKTLYQRINQSMRYLCEHLDPEGIYKKFRQCVRVDTGNGVGVMLLIDDNVLKMEVLSNPAMFMPESFESKKHWRDKLSDYLEKGEIGVPFIKDKLALSDDEMYQLELELSGAGDSIIYNIESHRITVVRQK